jgi:negative regulator of flagellin synthesis FlgM
MKIGHQPDISAAAVQATQSATAKAAGQNAPAAARYDRKSPGVGVTVSSLARGLEAIGSNSADVDMDKVNAVRQSIQQNTFAVNPEAIADKLLANAREMLNRSAG